jgi:hypothetical protein
LALLDRGPEDAPAAVDEEASDAEDEADQVDGLADPIESGAEDGEHFAVAVAEAVEAGILERDPGAELGEQPGEAPAEVLADHPPPPPPPPVVVEPDAPVPEGPPVPRRERAGGEHAPWKKLLVQDIGAIVLDDGSTTGRSKSFGAHCYNPAHGKLCRLNRTVNPGGVGKPQGRPLGLLVAWIWAHEHHGTKKQNSDLVNAKPRPPEAAEQLSFAQRCRARDWLAAQPHAAHFLQQEREPWPGEGLEPHGIA